MSARACQDCGSLMSLLETSHGGESTFRKMACDCGSRFESEERITRRLPLVPARTRRQPPAGAEAHPPTPTVASPPASVGGDRGGVSSGTTDPESDQGSKSAVLGNQTRARRNRDAEYTGEFERLWIGCDRWGHKEPAARAYVERGRPNVDDVIAAWKSYRASLPSWRNPKDVSAWLRIKGHLQTYAPAPPELPRAGKQAVPFAVAAEESRTDRHLDNLAEALLDD